jgi:Histidine kinase
MVASLHGTPPPRTLHDGAQQQLVSLALQLRQAQAAVPPGLGELAADLERIGAGLASTLEELREIARGIHPALLAERGLGPALKALARLTATHSDCAGLPRMGPRFPCRKTRAEPELRFRSGQADVPERPGRVAAGSGAAPLPRRAPQLSR